MKLHDPVLEERDYTEEKFQVKNQGDHTVNRHYPRAMLQFMAPEFTYVSGDVPDSEEELEFLLQKMKQFGPTFALCHKDTVSAFKIEGREWGDISPFAIRFPYSEKTAKRLSVFNWETHIYEKYQKVVVTVGQPIFNNRGQIISVDAPYVEHEEGVLSICVIDVPEELKSIVDGNSWARNVVISEFNFNAEQRVADLVSQDEANKLGKYLSMQSAYNSRITLPPLGEHVHESVVDAEIIARLNDSTFLKGDLLRSRKDLPADIVTSWANLKSEIYTQDGQAYLVAHPVASKNRARTNRQGISHFYGALYEGKIEDALVQEANDMLGTLERGQLPWFIKPVLSTNGDAVETYQRKFVEFANAGIPTNRSPHLTEMMGGQYAAMIGPRKQHGQLRQDTRRFPIPCALWKSIRSASDMMLCADPESWVDVMENEGYIGEHGLIVGEATFKDMALILGGADKDDHAEIDIRISTTRCHRFNTHPGDMVLVVVRYPVGYSSNGEDCASEYWVLKAHPLTEEWALDHFGDGNIPGIDLNRMPKRIDHIELPDPIFVPDGRKNLPETYTKDEVIEQIRSAQAARGLYGTHANLAMIAAQHQIPLEFIAPEETFIDLCSGGVASPSDLAVIDAKNMADLEVITKAGIPLDAGCLPRIEKIIPNDVIIERDLEGSFCVLIDFHRSLMESYNKRLKAMVADISKTEAAKYEDEVMMVEGQKPLLLRRFNSIELVVRAGRERISHDEWAQIADETVQCMDRAGISYEDQKRYVKEALVFLLRTGAGDRILCQGALLDIYIDILSENN